MAENDRKQFCTFFLDDLYFGVDLQRVQEVLRYQDMTAIPLAPDTISGLINLRGQIVTAVNLRKRLGLRDRPKDARPMNVVVRTDDGAVSLLVDAIDDVIEVGEESFEEAPETLEGIARELVRGVHKLDDKLLIILDTYKVVALDTKADQPNRQAVI